MPTRQQLVDMYRFVQWAAVRHRRKGLVVFGFGAVLALAGAALMPKTYYSEARLFVRFGRENQVDPTASGGQMVSLYESRESEINSLIEILKSRAILDRVVEELGPELVLYGQAPKQADGTGDRGQGTTDGTSTHSVGARVPATERPATDTTGTEHQLAVMRLTKDVVVAAPRKSNIITVGCKAKSPTTAQQIVTKLVEVYQEEHVRVHRSPGSYEFFKEQVRQSLAAWKKAADELKEMKDKLGIVTVEGRRKKLEDQIADIDSKQLANRSELNTARAKISSLTTLIAKLPETIVTQEVEGPNAAAEGMRQALYTLETLEQELAAKMQEDHPRLVAVRQQVRDLRQILDDQPSKKSQATEARNPARQGLEAALLAEKAQADALAERERSLTKSQEQLHRELTELNGQALAIDELQQRVALAEANHKEYVQRLEQSRINRTLDDERFSSLSLVQPASFVSTAAGPRRALVLLMGLLVAALSGMATALGAAWLNPLVTTAEQLAEVLDVPLAGVVPQSGLAMAA